MSPAQLQFQPETSEDVSAGLSSSPNYAQQSLLFTICVHHHIKTHEKKLEHST
jgi:hypothetical protein